MDGIVKKYDAFISYRHCEPDKHVAAEIQKKLENYRLPADETTGKREKKQLHIFRDESEFAVSPDLSEVIIGALKQSEYLIVICSPRLKDSEWCRTELETFLEISDRRHVLLVIADGEPAEVFPEVLTYEDVSRTDMSGNEVTIREKREPLAADCRGETGKERRHNMEQSVIRLAASILGKGYDDLRQRHRQQRARRRNLIMLVIFLIVVAVAAQSLYFLGRIREQNREIAEKYADIMASTSERLLADGRRADAIFAARSVLPDTESSDVNINAFKALVNAEGIYSSPNEYTSGKVITVASNVFGLIISEDASLAGVLSYNGYRYIVDTKSGEVLFAYEEETQGEGDMAFDGRSGIVMRRFGEPFVYRNSETAEETVLYDGEGWVYEMPDESGVLLLTTEGIKLVHEGKIVYSKDYTSMGMESGYEFFSVRLRFSADGEHACLLFSNLDNTDRVLQINTKTGEKEALINAGAMIDGVTTDGEKIVYIYNEDDTSKMCCYDIKLNKAVDEKELYGYGYYDICESNGVVVMASSEMGLVYDIESRKISSFVLKNGCYEMRSVKEGVLLTDFSGGYYICDGYYQTYHDLCEERETKEYIIKSRNGKFFMTGVGDSYITVYEKQGSDHCRPYADEPCTQIVMGFDDVAAYDAFTDRICGKYTDMNKNMIFAAGISSDGRFGYIQCWDNEVRIYDLDTLEICRIMYNCDGYCFGLHRVKEDGLYYLCCQSTYVCDSSMRHLITIPNLNVYGTLNETGEIVVMDDEGNKLVLSRISYRDVIEEADLRLKGYTPDEAVRQKYGF
ncbi:MAG: TIR domain-containing protein [Lachnospiraceae bacterium]|nr:TIR domain-containing protein [Lachnospiraceae bacterium]